MTKSDQTIQQKTDQLDGIVAWFNSEDFTLEQALDKFKQAEVIAEDVQKDLQSLKNGIHVIQQRFDQDGA
ncbi:MAG: hypothetical protein EOO17_02935 [Chloroflexi bacterium]|nr:MAG: hypothetical protein EOO17_02935 [Chloroflexota bacterium]